MTARYDAETDDVRQVALPRAGPPTVASARSGLARWYFENERAILVTTAVVLVLTLWELSGSRKWIDPLFTSSPSRIFRAARELVQLSNEMGTSAALKAAAHLFDRVYRSADAQEGPLAFREKRKPQWKGR